MRYRASYDLEANQHLAIFRGRHFWGSLEGHRRGRRGLPRGRRPAGLSERRAAGTPSCL